MLATDCSGRRGAVAWGTSGPGLPRGEDVLASARGLAALATGLLMAMMHLTVHSFTQGMGLMEGKYYVDANPRI